MKVAVTGCTGFVGSHLIEALAKQNRMVLSLGRSKPSHFIDNHTNLNMAEGTLEPYALSEVKVLVHVAARVHIMNDGSVDPLTEFRKVNTYGTIELAKHAAKSGVKRFIFLSSIKVNGESTTGRLPFHSNDKHNPEDPYGISKSEAESQLLSLAKDTGMEVVIIRPPLVYGPGVKANFASLMNLVNKGFPLPFGLISDNQRSLVSVYNLVDLIITCIDHPKAVNQVFLASDDSDVSTSGMVKEMIKALEVSRFQIPLPVWLYKLIGRITGKQLIVDRLIGSLQLDITHTKQTLQWQPPQTISEGFKHTAKYLIQSKGNK